MLYAFRHLCLLGVTSFALGQEVHLDHGDRRGRDAFLGGLSVTNITVGGKFEVEYAYEREGDESESELAVDKIELKLGMDLGEGVSLRSEVEWENGSDPETELDKAYLEVEREDWFPFALEIGRNDVLFGEFESHLIEDSLCQELGEMKRVTVQAIGEWEAWGEWEWSTAWVAGRMDGGNQPDTFSLSCRYEPIDGLLFGASYLSDLGQTDELLELREEERAPEVYEQDTAVPAVNAFLVYEQERWGVSLEYVAATEAFDVGVLDEETEMRPMTWSTEAYVVPYNRWELVGRFEGSNEFPDVPKLRYGVGAIHRVTRHLTLAADVLTGEYEDGESFDAVTVEAAIRF